jgi:hypothetical protein
MLIFIVKPSGLRRHQPSTRADITLTSPRFSNTNFHKADELIGTNTIPFRDGEVWFFNRP